MKKHPYPLAAAGIAACTALAALQPTSALAQGQPVGWQWEASIYGWFPSIGGSTRFPVSSGGASIDVSMGDVIDALKMTFMGSLEVRNGQWGLWTDLVYADFGVTRSANRDFTVGDMQLPADVSARLDLDLKNWIWTLAGTWSLASTQQYNADLLFGVRLLDMSQTLDWNFSGDISTLPLPGRTGSASTDLSNWDGVVGIKGRVNLDAERRWFVPYYADIGTGESKLTWQVNAGLGYRFDWGSVLATWRYMDYEMKSSSNVQSLDFNGPTVGVSFKW